MKMTLEEYKKKVEECLVKNNNCSGGETKKLMKTYEDDFQEFLNTKLSPEATAVGMKMHLL